MTDLIQNVLSDPADSQKTVIVLLAILDGVAGYMLNPDAWYLAYDDARKLCQHLGISETEFEAVKTRYQQFRLAKKARSPLASLHAPG